MQSTPTTPSAPETSLLARFGFQINSLLSRVESLNEDELFNLAVSARRLETSAFLLRGACVAELRRRAERLAGGRGKRDLAGTGVGAHLSRLAQELDVSVSTLQTDAQIHEVFFAGETGLACETTLSRDYYVTALAAPDPVQAISLAQEKTAQGAYNRDQFRKDVKALKEPAVVPRQPTVSVPGRPNAIQSNQVSVQIIPEALPAFIELRKHLDNSDEVIVAGALLYYLRSLSDGQPTANETPPADRPPRVGGARLVFGEQLPLLPEGLKEMG